MKKKSIKNLILSSKRKEQIIDGVYDGRYTEKIILDKKKQNNKIKARKKIKL